MRQTTKTSKASKATTSKATASKASTAKKARDNVNEYVEISFDDGNVLTRVYSVEGDVITLYINWYGLVVKAYMRYSKKKDKYWISFPSYKNKEDEYVDLCYLEDREVLEDYIMSIIEGLDLPHDSRFDD